MNSKYRIEWRDKEGYLHSAIVDSHVALCALAKALRASREVRKDSLHTTMTSQKN